MNNERSSRILIVDDERAQMQALCSTLKDHGYETVGCSSGVEALEAMASSRFDLLLTDLMMPGMDGITLLRSALSVDPDLVAVMMTGEGTIATAVEAMKAGALDFTLKPFKLSALLPVLTRALAMRNLRLENAELQRRIRTRTAQLEAANSELEAFAYSASHDLRAPLRAIGGFAYFLLNDSADHLNERDVDLIGRIQDSAKQMGSLIDGLLNLSRLGAQALSIGKVGVQDMVTDVLDEIQKEQQERTIEVIVGDLPDAVGDPILLRQVFVNLLSNAYKFTKNSNAARIEIGAEHMDRNVTYFVRDNGAGFDMQYVEKLFSVFQRLHTSKQFEGSGVGLSIVERIIRRHGGRIWAEAAVNEGASFYFALPAEAIVDDAPYAVTA